MEYIHEVEFAEVIAQWTKREYIKPGKTPKLPNGVNISILTDEDYDDPVKMIYGYVLCLIVNHY